MKKLILAQLKKANPGVPENLLGPIADKLLPKVTTADDIEGAISELEENSILSISEMAILLQKEGDRRVAGIKKPVKPEIIEDEEEEEPTTDIGKLTKMIEGLTNTVTSLVQEKATQSIQTKMEADLKEKGIPLMLLKGRVPQKEEEMEAVLAEIESDFTGSGMIAKPANSKLSSFKAPLSAAGGVITDDDKPDPAIAKYLENKKAATDAQAK